MGRKPEPDTIGKTVRLHISMWDAVSEYRHDNRIPTLAQALRELIEAGLRAEQRREHGEENGE